MLQPEGGGVAPGQGQRHGGDQVALGDDGQAAEEHRDAADDAPLQAHARQRLVDLPIGLAIERHVQVQQLQVGLQGQRRLRQARVSLLRHLFDWYRPRIPGDLARTLDPRAPALPAMPVHTTRPSAYRPG